MIAWLRGELRARSDGDLVIDVGGVGYAVRVPLSVLGQADLGDTVELHIYTQVAETQLSLYGFEDAEQLAAFHALLGVSKVGPKLAVNVLSGITPHDLARAVDEGDVRRLVALHGVGKRLAERLTVELRGKIQATGLGATPAAAVPASSAFADLKSALQNLQYRPKEITQVLTKLGEDSPDAAFDELLRQALRLLKK